jgi:hypothetical protein
MKAFEFFRKLIRKLRPVKVTKPAGEAYGGALVFITQTSPDGNIQTTVLDGLGVIRLPDHWRN